MHMGVVQLHAESIPRPRQEIKKCLYGDLHPFECAAACTVSRPTHDNGLCRSVVFKGSLKLAVYDATVQSLIESAHAEGAASSPVVLISDINVVSGDRFQSAESRVGVKHELIT